MLKNKKKLIDKINEVCQCKSEYCLLKEIIICSHQDPRFLTQLKCVERFKFEESEREGRDIGWDEAHIRWVANGYAKRFAELYNEEVSANDICKAIFKK